MPETVIYGDGFPKGRVVTILETPVGVEVTKHDPVTGKTAKVTKRKSDKN